MKSLLVVLLCAAAIAVLSNMNNSDMVMELKIQQDYCDNVSLWKSSNQNYGHPNYNNVVCER